MYFMLQSNLRREKSFLKVYVFSCRLALRLDIVLFSIYTFWRSFYISLINYNHPRMAVYAMCKADPENTRHTT